VRAASTSLAWIAEARGVSWRESCLTVLLLRKGVAGRGVGEPEDDRGVEVLAVGVVLGHVSRVP
jgi:hypothetical protein